MDIGHLRGEISQVRSILEGSPGFGGFAQWYWLAGRGRRMRIWLLAGCIFDDHVFTMQWVFCFVFCVLFCSAEDIMELNQKWVVR